MKRILLFFVVCSIVFLQACKKETQTSSSGLTVSGFGPVVFATGDAISIYGTGFDTNVANDVVSFNGVAGEVATASPNRLQVIVPLLTTSGKITVTVHGKSITSQQTYKIVNVLQGTYSNSFILTPDKQYLLRGNVIFSSKLIIEAGTVIYGEKLTHGSLSANDIDFEGTQQNPIVFTSDQPPGSRYPGDWTGVVLNAQFGQINAYTPAPNGIMKYVRVEYAGYQAPGAKTLGTALNLGMGTNGTYEYLQTSYSAGTGILVTGIFDNSGGHIGTGYIHHIVAFGCMGDDFRLEAYGVFLQYGLGLKDPYFAANTYGNGIRSATIQGSVQNLVSNFTLIGYNPDARNLLNTGSDVTNNAGSGIKIGDSYIINGAPAFTSDNIAVYNSVVAGGWRAGVTVKNGGNYEAPAGGYYIRNSYITGTAPQLLPQRGGAFGELYTPPNLSSEQYYIDISSSPDRALFAKYNDTTKALSFSANKDDLGIKSLTDYQNLNKPGVLPASGSPLLTGASFPSGSFIDNPFINKDVTYIGAFGTEDWTAQWCDFNPQNTQY
jgi:hypothetical protein